VSKTKGIYIVNPSNIARLTLHAGNPVLNSEALRAYRKHAYAGQAPTILVESAPSNHLDVEVCGN
jgi:hypothetical protein